MNKTLYSQIAAKIAEQIENEVYLPGDKLPSIRKACQQFKVSVSTIQQAYTQLENLYLAEARPQSGYYVLAQNENLTEEPEMTDTGTPIPVSVNDGIFQVIKETEKFKYNFGAAYPHPDFLPVAQLQKTIRKISRHYLKEVLTTGSSIDVNLLLRRQLAQRMTYAGCQLSAADIVTTSGCKDALSLCLNAVAKKGDIIAIESPAFPGLLQTIEALEMNALEIPTHPKEGISIDALKLALEQWPIKACALIPTYNNPLGSSMPEDNRKALIELLKMREIPLIEDDLFGDLGTYGRRANALKSYDRDGLVLNCSSVSKSLGPGLKVGWISPGRYLKKIQKLKFLNSVTESTLSQMIVAEYFATGNYDKHIRRIRNIYAQNRKLMAACILEHFPKGTTISNPSGGYMLWVGLPAGFNTWKLYNLAIKDKISFLPGILFSPTGKYNNFLRLNAAIPWNSETKNAIIKLAKLSSQAID
ncbi:MAG: PLP-dependent aminotransferase family protein [Emcibacteraceae bacterium]